MLKVAQIYEKTDNLKEAARAYETVLYLDSKNIAVINTLMALYVAFFIHAAFAIVEWRRAELAKIVYEQ